MRLANLLQKRPAIVDRDARHGDASRRRSVGWVLSGWLALACVSGLTWVQSTLAQVTAESLIGGPVSDKEPYYQDLSEAIVRFREGNVDAARGLLAAARRKAPKLAPVEVMLATLLFDVGQTTAARAELEKAVHLHPQDPEAYVRLAELDAGDGRVTEAALLFAKASDLADAFRESPKRGRQVQFRALSGAAVIAESREQWSAARDYLQALVRVDPDNVAVRQRLAKALFKLGEVDEAQEVLEAINAADSKSIPADLTLAAFYNQAGDKVNADKYMQGVLEKGNDSLGAQIGLARWKLQAGELDDAQTHAQRARELDPDSLDAKVIAGVVARLRNDLETAQTLLEEAHLASPMNVDVNNQLALILLEKPDDSSRRRAAEFAELNQRLNPTNADAVATLGWVLFRQGRKAEAERLFGAIATALAKGSAPVSGESIYYLANVRADQGRTDEARRLLEILLEQDVPSLYRQDAQALLARLDEPAEAERSTDEPAADETETTGETKRSTDVDGSGAAPSSTDPKKSIQP